MFITFSKIPRRKIKRLKCKEKLSHEDWTSGRKAIF